MPKRYKIVNRLSHTPFGATLVEAEQTSRGGFTVRYFSEGAPIRDVAFASRNLTTQALKYLIGEESDPNKKLRKQVSDTSDLPYGRELPDNEEKEILDQDPDVVEYDTDLDLVKGMKSADKKKMRGKGGGKVQIPDSLNEDIIQKNAVFRWDTLLAVLSELQEIPQDTIRKIESALAGNQTSMSEAYGDDDSDFDDSPEDPLSDPMEDPISDPMEDPLESDEGSLEIANSMDKAPNVDPVKVGSDVSSLESSLENLSSSDAESPDGLESGRNVKIVKVANGKITGVHTAELVKTTQKEDGSWDAVVKVLGIDGKFGLPGIANSAGEFTIKTAKGILYYIHRI